MSWLRLIHALGLTNLSDADVRRYEKQESKGRASVPSDRTKLGRPRPMNIRVYRGSRPEYKYADRSGMAGVTVGIFQKHTGH